MNGKLPNGKPRSYIDYGEGIDSDLPTPQEGNDTLFENNNDLKNGGCGDVLNQHNKKRLSKKCNGVSYSNIPTQSDVESNPAGGHKALRVNAHAGAKQDAHSLSIPRVQRSQSFSPRYSTPAALNRSNSNRKSMDSISATGSNPKSANTTVTPKPVSNGAIPHVPKYQNVPYGGGHHDKNAKDGGAHPAPRNGFHRGHSNHPLDMARSFDETTETLL